MAGVAGKNKIERGFRILFDDVSTARDITASLIPGTLTGGGYVLDEVELTGVSDTVKSFLGGHGNAPVSGQFYLDDTATTGAMVVLDGMVGSVGTLTLQWGSAGAAPSTGDPEWEGEYVLLGFTVSLSGGKAVMNATWQPAPSSAAAWGTVA